MRPNFNEIFAKKSTCRSHEQYMRPTKKPNADTKIILVQSKHKFNSFFFFCKCI